MTKKTRRPVETTGLELFDGRGRRRALLSTHAKDGMPFLALYDDERRQRIVLGLEAGGLPAVTMYGDSGRASLGCGMDDQGRVGLTLFDRDGNQGIDRKSVV